MKTCCAQSFAVKGIAEHFRRAAEGDTHTCPTCGQVWRLTDGQWRAVEKGTT